MPSPEKKKPRRVRANRMPLGKLTPAVPQAKATAKALELRNAMADCTLSDTAIQMIALRVNTGAPISQLARGLGMERTAAHIMMAKPQAQQLIAELARALLGEAAIMGTHTMMKIMRGKDVALAYRAADTMMERAGLGISQRTTHEGATKTVFAFAFGAPQASTLAPDGTRGSLSPGEGASKTQALGLGEAPSRVISEVAEDQRVALESSGPLQPVRRRGPKSIGLKSAT
jgi:histone H3/H4